MSLVKYILYKKKKKSTNYDYLNSMSIMDTYLC